MERRPVFDRIEHRIACIGGWLVFAIVSAYSLWAVLWAVIGVAVLKVALNTTASESCRYGFLAWVGFWSAWPYVLYARSAWRKPNEAEKLSATQLARARHEPVAEIQRKLIASGYIEVKSGVHFFTDLGRSVGGEIRKNHPEASEGHMVWPANINL